MGDEDQLQSVEYGNILSDLIHSGVIETVPPNRSKKAKPEVFRKCTARKLWKNEFDRR